MAYLGSSASPLFLGFGGVNAQSFNGTGAATAFTLNRTVAATKDIEVLVNNVQQSPYDGSYSVSGTTLTFSEAPTSGTNNIYVIYRDVGQIQSVPPDASITTAKLATGAVTAEKIASGAVQTFAAGTVMLFGQTSAPTGWTKDTSNFDNSALRVVTGTAGSGGTENFTAAFASQTPAGTVSVAGLSVGSTTLTTTQIPSHNHSVTTYVANIEGPSSLFGSGASGSGSSSSATVGSSGGGGSHNHGLSGSASFTGTAINLAVKYVDVIRATKN